MHLFYQIYTFDEKRFMEEHLTTKIYNYTGSDYNVVLIITFFKDKTVFDKADELESKPVENATPGSQKILIQEICTPMLNSENEVFEYLEKEYELSRDSWDFKESV